MHVPVVDSDTAIYSFSSLACQAGDSQRLAILENRLSSSKVMLVVLWLREGKEPLTQACYDTTSDDFVTFVWTVWSTIS